MVKRGINHFTTRQVLASTWRMKEIKIAAAHKIETFAN